jgi:AraC-like DNA-binding protein
VEVVEFTTDQPDVAHEAINATFGSPATFAGDPTNFFCDLRIVDGTTIGGDRIRHSMSTRVALQPVDFFLADTVISGHFTRFKAGEADLALGPGDTVLLPTDRGLEAEWVDVDAATVRIPSAEIDRVAREQTGSDAKVHFEAVRPLSTGHAEVWRNLNELVHAELGSPEPALDSPLVEARMVELIAATALATFANSTLRAGGTQPRPAAVPAAVRRGVAFIDENAGRPLTVSAIAEAAGVTPRALQYGFARHLDESPMTYLGRVRLERAHGELLAADPAEGATVSAIARRWGYAKPGNFAARYRAAYGRPPGETLRS